MALLPTATTILPAMVVTITSSTITPLVLVVMDQLPVPSCLPTASIPSSIMRLVVIIIVTDLTLASRDLVPWARPRPLPKRPSWT